MADFSRLRQHDLALGGLGVLTVEKGGVADGGDEHATTFIGDLRAESLALVTFGTEEAQFHQLVRAKEFLQLDEEGGREPALADLRRGIELLA